MRKQLLVILLTVLSAGVSADASAILLKEPPDTVCASIKELTEVEVTAARNRDELKATAPVHSLDAFLMLATGVTDISDALRRLPGVTLRDYGGSGGMKTISVRGLGAQHTNVIYDGAVLGDVQGGQTDLSRYSLHNMGNLTLNIGDGDDITVPARSLSAASTLSVSSLQNPDMLQADPEIDLKLRVASFLTINPYFRFATSNGDNLGMSLTGEYTHARNDYPFRFNNGDQVSREKRNNSQINLAHAEWNGIWKPTSASRLQAKTYFYTSSRYLPGPVIYYNCVSNQRLNDLNAFGQLSYSTRISSMFTLKVLAKYNYADTRYRDKDGKYPGGELDQRYRLHEEYITSTLICRLPKSVSLSYAADFWHNSLKSNLRGDNKPFRNSFLQAISAKWDTRIITLTVHGLYSVIHDKSSGLPDGKTEQQFSPSAGISVRPLQNLGWWIRASYKNIFRMPTFNELYFDHYGSVNLRPEKADLFNLGMTFEKSPNTWIDRFSVTLDAYHNKVRNKIVAMPYNLFVMTMTNLGKVRILGCDASVSLHFAPAENHSINIEGTYSYQRAATMTDRAMTDWMKQVAYTPLNSGSWSLNWENPWVNIAVHGIGCSSRFSTNNNIPSTRIPGYMEFGLSFNREFSVKRNTISLRADVANILDKQYEIIARYPMPGRSFSLTLGYGFR